MLLWLLTRHRPSSSFVLWWSFSALQFGLGGGLVLTTISNKNAAVPLSPNQQALANVQFPRAWVPLASVAELDPERPTPVQFMGLSYVTYRNNDGQWVVMDDACPHRLAPLSEGRVDRKANRLECSYHGWAFDANGQCQTIPQATENVFRAATANARCHVKSYSVMVEKNALFAWLWPEDSLSVAHIKEANPEGIMDKVKENTSTYTRDLPYGWDTLLENLIDPAHVPFAHHGLQGTRDDAIPINMTTPTSITQWGFNCSIGDRTMKSRRQITMDFRAPFVIQYSGFYEQTAESVEKGESPRPFGLTNVMIPTKPGHSRFIVYPTLLETKNRTNAAGNVVSLSLKQKSKKVPFFFRILRLMPTWILHQFSNRFLDSDLAFLHYQERERERREGNDNVDSSSSSYYMPAPADRSVTAFRKWTQQYAHVLRPLPTKEYSRTELFDRWTQHSAHCRHCSQAAASIVQWRKKTYGLLAVSILLSKFLWARLVAVSCLILLRLYVAAEETLTKGGFDHYKNH